MALGLPARVRRELAAWRDQAIAGRAELRPVAGDSLHVTLAFLGYRPEDEIPEIGRALVGVLDGRPACALAPAGLVPLPPRRPRLFALDLDDREGRAVELQAAVSGALEQARFYRPEKRPFWPHVTLARVKRGERAGSLEAPPAPVGTFEAGEVVLYRSTLRREGAVYEPLSAVTLGV